MLTYRIDPGFFINTSPNAWSAASNTTMGGKTVSWTPNGITIIWSNGTKKLYHATPGGNSSAISKYRFIGSGYLLLLDSDITVGPVQHRVYVVNFDSVSEKLILLADATDASIQPPFIHYSQGTGSAFLVFSFGGTQFQFIGIYRSDTGDALCTLPFSVDGTSQILAEATGIELRIYYGINGQSRIQKCPQPRSLRDP